MWNCGTTVEIKTRVFLPLAQWFQDHSLVFHFWCFYSHWYEPKVYVPHAHTSTHKSRNVNFFSASNRKWPVSPWLKSVQCTQINVSASGGADWQPPYKRPTPKKYRFRSKSTWRYQQSILRLYRFSRRMKQCKWPQKSQAISVMTPRHATGSEYLYSRLQPWAVGLGPISAFLETFRTFLILVLRGMHGIICIINFNDLFCRKMREWFSDSERNEAGKLKQVWAAVHHAVFARFLQWLAALHDKWEKSVNCGRTRVFCLGNSPIPNRTYSNTKHRFWYWTSIRWRDREIIGSNM